MVQNLEPGLFGLINTNKNFSNKSAWGKNQFNNTFPAALANYMHSQNIPPVYIKMSDQLTVEHSNITVDELFGKTPFSDDLFFSFETVFTPYQRYLIGDVPRADLVTMQLENETATCLQDFEIKLTALPDSTTNMLDEDQYSCELVVRPDTIVYLAASIARANRQDRQYLFELLNPVGSLINDWTDIETVLPHLNSIIESLNTLLVNKIYEQSPLLIQPIWKSLDNTAELAEDCLDIFVWSDYAFTRLFLDNQNSNHTRRSINRFDRSSIWLFKMLYDFSIHGQFDHRATIDNLTYNTRNDKAFAMSGARTHRYLSSPELTSPRVPRSAIRHIILGGGEELLSPERRFDAVIVNTPGLFD